MRRCVFVKDAFYITRKIDRDTVIDVVPLSEITEISRMSKGDDLKMKSLTSTQKLTRKASLSFIRKTSESPEDGKDEAGRPSDEFSRVCRDLAGKANAQSIFQINTIPEGFNLGRVYYFQAGSEQRCQKIISQTSALAEAARKRADRSSRWEKAQDMVRSVQTALPFQLCMVALILTVSGDTHYLASPSPFPFMKRLKSVIICKPPQNFAVNAAESQMSAELTDANGGASPLGRRLELLDMFFTIVFTVRSSGPRLGIEPVMLNTIVLTRTRLARPSSPPCTRKLRAASSLS